MTSKRRSSILDAYRHQFCQSLGSAGVDIQSLTITMFLVDDDIVLVVNTVSDSVMKPGVFEEETFLVKLPKNIQSEDYLLGYPSSPIVYEIGLGFE